MATRFDPYERWLSIPPTEQPPSHYRLLGLDQFEPDADKIRSAANRVMDQLDELSGGEHADEMERLLNEVAAARRCLLHADQKNAYDATLREKTPRPSRAGKPKSATPASQPRPFVKGRPVPLPKKRGSRAEPQTSRVDGDADSAAVPTTTQPSFPVDNVSVSVRGRGKARGKDNRQAPRKDKLVPIVAWTAGGCVLLVIVVGVLLGTAGLNDGSSETRPPADASYGRHASPSSSSSGPRNPDPRGPYGGRSLGDLLKKNPNGGATDNSSFGDGNTNGFPNAGPGTSAGGIEPLRIDAVPGGDEVVPTVIDTVPGGGDEDAQSLHPR